MDLKDKQKVVKVVEAAEKTLARLEESIQQFEAQNKTPSKTEKQLLTSIYRALELLKTNPFSGQPVPHHLWPKQFEALPNLFRMELSGFWRFLYYVTGNETMIVSVVFETRGNSAKFPAC